MNALKKVPVWVWAIAGVAVLGVGERAYKRHQEEAQKQQWVMEAAQRRAYMAAHPESRPKPAPAQAPAVPIALNEWPVPEGRIKQLIPMGADTQTVLAAIGKPSSRMSGGDSETWTYSELFKDEVTGQVGTVRIRFANGRVANLHFN